MSNQFSPSVPYPNAVQGNVVRHRNPAPQPGYGADLMTPPQAPPPSWPPSPPDEGSSGLPSLMRPEPEPWYFGFARKLPAVGFLFYKDAEGFHYVYHDWLWKKQLEYSRYVVPMILLLLLLGGLYFVYPYVLAIFYTMSAPETSTYRDSIGRVFANVWSDFDLVDAPSDPRVGKIMRAKHIPQFTEEQLSSGAVDLEVWSRSLTSNEPFLERRHVPLEMLRDAMIDAADKLKSQCVCSRSLGILEQNFVLGPEKRFMIQPVSERTSGGGQVSLDVQDPVWLPTPVKIAVPSKAIVAYYPATFSSTGMHNGSPVVRAHVSTDTLACIAACLK